MEKNTIVAGMTTENTTKSGNNVHDAEGKFTSKDSSFDFSDKMEDDIEFNEDEFNSLGDIDVDELLFNEDEFDSSNNTDVDDILFGKPKNIEEMSNEELIKEIKDCENFLKGEGLDMSKMKKGAFGGDLKLKCSNLRQMKKMLKMYNIDLNGTTMRMSKSTIAKAWVKTGFDDYYDEDLRKTVYQYVANKELALSNEHFSSYDFSKSDTIGDIKSNFNNDCSEEYYSSYIITHELGHALHNTMFRDYLVENNKTKLTMFEAQAACVERVEFLNNLRKDVYNQYIQDNEHIEYKDFIQRNSEYGRTNPSEWFAEMFASANCGKPTDVAKSFMKVLQQKGYIKGGI